MNKSVVLGILFLYLTLSVGCKNDPSETDINFSVENDFNIFPLENLNEEPRTFQFKIETTKAESCEDAIIDLTPTAQENTIGFTIEDIPEPDCSSPNYSALANYDVGVLNENIYKINKPKGSLRSRSLKPEKKYALPCKLKFQSL